MAIVFIVEDGTGLDTATSYLSVSDLKTILDSNGYDYSLLTDDQLSVYLNRATAYIDSTYYQFFNGYRKSYSQGLEWPRVSAYYVDNISIPSDSVPVQVKNATAQAVNQIMNDVDLSPTIADGSVKSESFSVDPISESKTYQVGRSMSKPVVNSINDALFRVTGNVGVLRATRG